MNSQRNHRARAGEKGVTLLIVLFALVLITGVAIALLLMSGTESAIAGNYRSSTQVFYAAQAGLEEGRGRLWSGHPNPFGAFVPQPMAVGQARYILNPSAGETVQPSDLSASSAYRDTQYQQEFGVPVTSATVQTTASTSGTLLAGVPGPLFKWVRITPKTERAAGIDVNDDGTLNNTTPIYFDGSNQNLLQQGQQVFRITSLAVLPNGSQRMLQADVAANSLNLTFPAAMTFIANGATYFLPASSSFAVNGTDEATCGTPAEAAKPAIGVLSDSDASNSKDDQSEKDKKDKKDNEDDKKSNSSKGSDEDSGHTGGGSTPSVQNVSGSLPAYLQSVTALEAIITQIRASATQVVTGPVSSLASYGSPSAPVIAVVNGDLSLSGNITGYGILVVTGRLTVTGDVGWRGIVLVVGQGSMTVNGGGSNSFNGALVLAKTRDAAGNLLATPGSTLLNWNGGGSGVYYDSCQVRSAQNGVPYRVLSFREVTQ
ncbi:MAG: hypothetical protein HY234_05915 [Acidobacteria bacterium]|nr:hypothetical protein [Acidobacteriota bacterium]MBI3662572.1 hypothetical protein [Acidobacteriota bacterium]